MMIMSPRDILIMFDKIIYLWWFIVFHNTNPVYNNYLFEVLLEIIAEVCISAECMEIIQRVNWNFSHKRMGMIECMYLEEFSIDRP